MILDNSWVFSNGQALTVTAASTNIVDLTGAGSGNAPNLSFGNATTFAEDLGTGTGGEVPQILASIGAAAPTGGTSINVQFQGAPDNGSNAPGTYTTYVETGAIPIAQLSANGLLMRVAYPRRIIGIAMPRFIRLNYTIVGTFANFTVFAALLLDPAENDVGSYPSGFVAV
jgi:hypothetical protein